MEGGWQCGLRGLKFLLLLRFMGCIWDCVFFCGIWSLNGCDVSSLFFLHENVNACVWVFLSGPNLDFSFHFFLTVTAPALLLVFVPTQYLFSVRGEVEK